MPVFLRSYREIPEMVVRDEPHLDTDMVSPNEGFQASSPCCVTLKAWGMRNLSVFYLTAAKLEESPNYVDGSQFSRDSAGTSEHRPG